MNRIALTLFSILLMNMVMKAQNTSGYLDELDKWHHHRISELKSENGWLNLAGLFWLNEGKNTFGSSNSNNIVFPFDDFPAHAGYFERKGDIVRLINENNLDIILNNKKVKDELIFDGIRNSPVITYNDLRWVIIKRDTKIGIRLRNLTSAAIQNFPGVQRFPVDESLKIQATLVSVSYQRFIPVTNVLGQTNHLPSPGQLVFKIGSNQYSLDALEEGDELFIIFGDDTNGKESYPSGRFLYAAKPGTDGKTILDFNKSINPPCAFTSFATCPLPPKQNILPAAIKAGEKNFHMDLH